jgi:hypothetical protein
LYAEAERLRLLARFTFFNFFLARLLEKKGHVTQTEDQNGMALPKTKRITPVSRATSADFWIKPCREANLVGFGFRSWATLECLNG